MEHDAWLAAEIERIWLAGEIAFARSGRRAVPELEAILRRRRARRGPHHGDPGTALREAIEIVQRHVVHHRPSAPIASLVKRFGLRDWEAEALIVAIAPHVDPQLFELFAALRGGVRRGVDLALVGELLGATRASRLALLDALEPKRPLVRWGLVEVSGAELPHVSRVLSPSLDVIAFLGGRPSMVELERADRTFDDLVLPAAVRARVVDVARANSWVVVWGRRGAGKATLAARLAAHRERPLVRCTVPREEAARAIAVRDAQRSALLHDAVLYVAASDPDDTLRRCADFPGALVLGVEAITEPRYNTPRPVEEIALTLPDEPQQLELWNRYLGDDCIDLDRWRETIARAYKLTAGEIAGIAAEARGVAASRDRRVERLDVRAGIERRMRSELADMAWRLDVTATWDEIILPAPDQKRLRELIARRKHAGRVYREWGLSKRLQYGMGLVALFSGPPGTGKTMLAGLVAAELDMDIYQVDLSQVVSKWIGETEKKIGKLFDLAERTQAVLLFDEADSLLGKRTDVSTSNDRFANANVNYLLQRIERYSGIAILTTNRAEAARRRAPAPARIAPAPRDPRGRRPPPAVALVPQPADPGRSHDRCRLDRRAIRARGRPHQERGGARGVPRGRCGPPGRHEHARRCRRGRARRSGARRHETTFPTTPQLLEVVPY